MTDVILMLAVFTASFGVGYAMISRVPPRLHTPLMSMTNAISAVTILGALMLFAEETTAVEKCLGGAALAAAAFNMLGGFAITHQMLKLFQQRDSAD